MMSPQTISHDVCIMFRNDSGKNLAQLQSRGFFQVYKLIMCRHWICNPRNDRKPACPDSVRMLLFLLILF